MSRFVCLWFPKCLHSYGGRKEVRKNIVEEIENKLSYYVTEDRRVPDHQNRVKEMRSKNIRTHHESLAPTRPVPLLQFPSITLPQLLHTLWCDSMQENQHQPPPFSVSHSPAPPHPQHLMALEPAMLPWEPAGDSRHPLHLFSFISFWKGIKWFFSF